MGSAIHWGRAAALLGCLATSAALSAAPLTKTYAQGLVDRAAFLHPEVLRLDLAVAPDAAHPIEIIATTEPSALHTTLSAAEAKPACQPDSTGTRLRCMAALRDTPGTVIGMLRIEQRLFHGQATAPLEQAASALAQEFAESTPDRAALLDVMTIAPKAGDLQAQCMILGVLAHHPDLMVLAMHVTPKGTTVNKMLAINEPRFEGKTSEASEQLLATNGNVLLESFSKTHRLETHVPILAADGSQVGTLATVYFWHRQDEMPALLEKTFAVQRELQPQIRDLDALYEPCAVPAVAGGESR